MGLIEDKRAELAKVKEAIAKVLEAEEYGIGTRRLRRSSLGALEKREARLERELNELENGYISVSYFQGTPRS